MLVLVATRLHALRIGGIGRYAAVGAMGLVVVAVWDNALLPLKLYPALVSVTLLAIFGHSLAFPPSMVERFARLREPELPVHAIAYTRRVTQVWCGFFAINGLIALGTAFWASQAQWSLYTGVIAYVFMGLLFGGEYLVRRRFKRMHP